MTIARLRCPITTGRPYTSGRMISRHREGASARTLVAAIMLGAIMTPGLPSAQQQEPRQPDPPVELTADEDRARIMTLLGIESLPPGASGSDPATYDESVANPYPALPDPLVASDGARITTRQQWDEIRRPQIADLFAREVYGRVPTVTPAVDWVVDSTVNDGTTVTRELTGHVDNSAYPLVEVGIELTVVTPADAAGPVPVIMQLGFPRGSAFRERRPESGPDWRDLLLGEGWGYAIVSPSSVQPDNGAGLTRGIIGLVNRGQPRALDDWGALAAWGWGASRALDFFETDPAVDAGRVGLQGHSRYGKAALVAMAADTRFAIAYISSSGAGGAKLHRRRYGELIENVLAANEYHWMAGNYFRYGGNWDALPVDSHSLIALVAPRPVFISAGNEGDLWVDPKGSFLAAVGASPVYELLGRRGVGATEFPPIDTPLIDGDIGFHQHTAGHTAAPTWPTFIEFARRYLHGSGN